MLRACRGRLGGQLECHSGTLDGDCDLDRDYQNREGHDDGHRLRRDGDENNEGEVTKRLTPRLPPFMFTAVAFFCPRLGAKHLCLFGHCLTVSASTILSFTILPDLLFPFFNGNLRTVFLGKKLGLCERQRLVWIIARKRLPLQRPLVALSASGAVFQWIEVPCSFLLGIFYSAKSKCRDKGLDKRN